MKCIIARILLMSLLLTSVFLFCGCKNDVEEEKYSSDKPDIFALPLGIEEYIMLSAYKDLTISVSEGESKGDAVWNIIVEGSEIKSYPQELLDYYCEQISAQYRYYAERSGKTLDEVLADHGKTKASIEEDAKEFVKEDLVYVAIVKAEGITLTDEDIDAHFDKFVSQYVSIYGYTEKYVKENLSDIVLDTMLHDKTIEFLIINNKFE